MEPVDYVKEAIISELEKLPPGKFASTFDLALVLFNQSYFPELIEDAITLLIRERKVERKFIVLSSVVRLRVSE